MVIRNDGVVGLAHFCMMVLAAYELRTSDSDLDESEVEGWLVDTIDALKDIVTTKLGRTLDLSA